MAKGGRPAELLAPGRYIELLSELEPFPEGGTARAEALTWAVRCRLEQGYVRAAADLPGHLYHWGGFALVGSWR